MRVAEDGRIIIANNLRELEEIVKVDTRPTSSRDSDKNHLQDNGFITSDSEKLSTEGEEDYGDLAAEDGPFPFSTRQRVCVTSEEMQRLKANYGNGHAFVVCVISHIHGNERSADGSESESDVSSEGEEEARERKKRSTSSLRSINGGINVEPSMTNTDVTTDEPALEDVGAVENTFDGDAEKELDAVSTQSREQDQLILEVRRRLVFMDEEDVEKYGEENDVEEEEERCSDPISEQANQELTEEETEETPVNGSSREESLLKQQLEQKIKQRIESERMRQSGSQPTSPAPSTKARYLADVDEGNESFENSRLPSPSPPKELEGTEELKKEIQAVRHVFTSGCCEPGLIHAFIRRPFPRRKKHRTKTSWSFLG